MTGNCRFCGAPLMHTFADLGEAPLSNAFLKAIDNNITEPVYPLHTYVCDQCFLVQLDEFETPEQIFSDYAYFSSYSESWLEHVRKYTVDMIERFSLCESSNVIEVASNDGYLLQYFIENNIKPLGIEPAKNVADAAIAKGIPTLNIFLGAETANQLKAGGNQADLLIGNNVLAHVPDINDFISGMKIILKSSGVLTMEFPHLLRLMQDVQFDTIYHEHFSYFSLTSVKQIFLKHGLLIFDVEELDTHGGSLRIYVQHFDTGKYKESNSVEVLLGKEQQWGITDIEIYSGFQEGILRVKDGLNEFLKSANKDKKVVVAYGAAAKGNTLLNYCGINTNHIQYVVDKNKYKQGMYMPGSHIPIYKPEKLSETKPDYILILPWNLRDEIIEQLSYVREWGAKFVIPIPKILIQT